MTLNDTEKGQGLGTEWYREKQWLWLDTDQDREKDRDWTLNGTEKVTVTKHWSIQRKDKDWTLNDTEKNSVCD